MRSKCETRLLSARIRRPRDLRGPPRRFFAPPLADGFYIPRAGDEIDFSTGNVSARIRFSGVTSRPESVTVAIKRVRPCPRARESRPRVSKRESRRCTINRFRSIAAAAARRAAGLIARGRKLCVASEGEFSRRPSGSDLYPRAIKITLGDFPLPRSFSSATAVNYRRFTRSRDLWLIRNH